MVFHGIATLVRQAGAKQSPGFRDKLYMELILILGPMKSGKSLELIGHFAPLKYTDIPFALYQHAKNVRDEHIWARDGVTLEARKVDTLEGALQSGAKVVGVDEMHMFDEQEADVVEELLKRGTRVIVSGLDTDYQGRMFGIIRRLLELGPKGIKFKRAVCEKCKSPEAIYTQVLEGDEPLVEGMPSVIPDDGTYVYKPVCRVCFVKG